MSNAASQQGKQDSSANHSDSEWEDEEEFYVVMENKHLESTEVLHNCKKYAIAVCFMIFN